MTRRRLLGLGLPLLGLAVIAAGVLLAGARAVPPDLAPDAVMDPSLPSITYGIQASLWWNPATRPRDLELIRLMNFSHVKQIFAWSDIQPEPGRWDWRAADEVVAEVMHRGLKLIARLDGPPAWAVAPVSDTRASPVDARAFARYCDAIAQRYAGQIAGYQVWNEPNLRREWGTEVVPEPAVYVALLRPCDQAIKTADPDAIVISAGLAPTGTEPPDAIPDARYLQALYDAGLAGAYDVLGLHAPGYGAPPWASPEEVAANPDLGGQRWMAFRHVEDMRAIMVANGAADRQIAILEMGWTTDEVHPDYSWHAVSEAQQAEYLVAAYAWAVEHWRPWVGLMSAIYIADPDWTEADEQYWWAITTPGYPNPGVRQAFIDLANMQKVSGDRVIPARDPGAPEAAQHVPLGPRD